MRVFILVVVFILVFPSIVIASDFEVVFDDANSLIGVSYLSDTTKQIKVKISNGQNSVIYDVDTVPNNWFSLSLGTGRYEIEGFIQIEGNRYKRIHSSSYLLKDDSNVFLNSNKIIHWQKIPYITELSNRVVDKEDSDIIKARKIYEYVVKTYNYDYTKAQMVTSKYHPDLSIVAKADSLICYDYAVLVASLLRAQNIPTKVVFGYGTEFSGYHAWNEIYIDGQGWITVDTTIDAQLYRSNKLPNTMKKDNRDYKIKYVI